MRSLRQATKHAFASKWRWPACPRRRKETFDAERRTRQFSMKTATEMDPKLVKQLREKTNAGMMDCKRALVESGGVLVEVNCETDFVARNENFREFVKDITLHIAAAHPLYVSRGDVPGNLIEAEREIYKAQAKGKPENVVEKIVDGKLDKFFSTVCLLEQGFIKNPDETIGDLVKAKIAELGENIVIRRFVRYLVGEPLPNEA